TGHTGGVYGRGVTGGRTTIRGGIFIFNILFTFLYSLIYLFKNNNTMTTKEAKAKLKRRGKENYNKYFFNDIDTITYIINCIDNNIKIDEDKCQTIFNITDDYLIQIYELIMYYPNKLKEIKY